MEEQCGARSQGSKAFTLANKCQALKKYKTLKIKLLYLDS